jgi:hypothetical protein
MPSAKWYINVNKQVIARNARDGTNHAPVRVQRGKSGKPTYCEEVEVPGGSVIRYSAHDPLLKCGARLVIECPTEPKILKY